MTRFLVVKWRKEPTSSGRNGMQTLNSSSSSSTFDMSLRGCNSENLCYNCMSITFAYTFLSLSIKSTPHLFNINYWVFTLEQQKNFNKMLKFFCLKNFSILLLIEPHPPFAAKLAKERRVLYYNSMTFW